MVMYMKKRLCVILVAAMILTSFTGCDKQRSEYNVSAVFAYDDIQETKDSLDKASSTDAVLEENSHMNREGEDQDSATREESSLKSDKTSDNDDSDINDESKVRDNKKQDDNLEASNMKPKDAKELQGNNEPINSDSDFNVPTEDIVQSPNNDALPTTIPEYQAPEPTSGSFEGDTSSNPGEGSSETGETTNPDASTDTSVASGGDANLDTPTMTDAPVEDPTEEPTTEEPVAKGLEYEGDLGWYIWGETPDTSNLHIYYVEGEERTEIFDYSISMNYPDRLSLSMKTYDDLNNGVGGNAGNGYVYATYIPGTYNATIIFGDYFCEVPYELKIVYIGLDIRYTNYCTDFENHKNDFEDGFAIFSHGENDDPTLIGNTGYHFCPNCSTCYFYEYGPVEGKKDYSYYNSLCGGLVYVPLYYDYTFSNEDIAYYNISEEYIVGNFNVETVTLDKDSLPARREENDQLFLSCYISDFCNSLIPENIEILWIKELH